jgi:hypothetical protein
MVREISLVCFDCLYLPKLFFSYSADVTFIGDRAVKLDLNAKHLLAVMDLFDVPHSCCDMGPQLIQPHWKDWSPMSHSVIRSRDVGIIRKFSNYSGANTVLLYVYRTRRSCRYVAHLGAIFTKPLRNTSKHWCNNILFLCPCIESFWPVHLSVCKNFNIGHIF